MSSSDSYLVIWEFECLELQYPIISIFGSGFLKFISQMYLVKLIYEEHSGWKMFLFSWSITENFSLAVLNFMVLIHMGIWVFTVWLPNSLPTKHHWNLCELTLLFLGCA